MKKRLVAIGVIPARYGSRRLPAKPLIDLLGKPMVQRVYERAIQARLLDKVVVATDDGRIADAVRSFGGVAIMTSPRIRSGSDRVAAVARKLRADIFVNIQGDEPLISPRMIDHCVRLLMTRPHAVVGTLARRIESLQELLNPGVVKVVFDKTGNALYFSRSLIPYLRDRKVQSSWLSHSKFYKHIGIYAYRARFLRAYPMLHPSGLELAEKLEQLRILENGYPVTVGVTALDSIPIDTAADVRRVRALLNRTNKTSHRKSRL